MRRDGYDLAKVEMMAIVVFHFGLVFCGPLAFLGFFLTGKMAGWAVDEVAADPLAADPMVFLVTVILFLLPPVFLAALFWGLRRFVIRPESPSRSSES